MEAEVAVGTLAKLGVENPQSCVNSLQDGSTSLLRTASGATLALLRRGNTYDSLLVGSQVDGAVFPLRVVLEDAFLPLSERYASEVGVALQQRDAIRKRIREAAVALDVIASGRLVSVPPPDFPIYARLEEYVDDGVSSVDQMPEHFVDDWSTLNQLQANVVSWSKEIDRIVHISRTGPGAVLTAEEETVFWSSLDAALSAAENFIASPIVKVSLDILARKRRATGFLIETSVTLGTARRNSAAVLGLVQGLPLVALRSAETIPALKEAVIKLLEHIASKIRGSAFSVDRSLSLIHSMGDDVTRSIARILSPQSNLISISFPKFTSIIEECCELFEAWSHGFDTCRQVVREAARMRGESVPPRSSTQISRLYAHLSEINELRVDQQSLRALLTELSTDPSRSSERVEMLDSAFSALSDASRAIDHFKVSESDETKWYEAVSSYRMHVKLVEEVVCSDYLDIIERSSQLSALADVTAPFTASVDKQFMSASVEEALPYVLQLAGKDLKTLQRRERAMNLRNVMHIANGIPVICSVLFECQQICNRASSILKNIEAVVGKARMEVMADLNDFVSAVRILKGSAQPLPRLTQWLDELDTKVPDDLLFNVVEDDSQHKFISLNLDVQNAYFSMVYSLKTNFTGAPFSKHHSELSRFASKIHPVFLDLRQALRCYMSTTENLEALESPRIERLFPFVHALLRNGEDVLQKGFSLRWNAEPLKLSIYASDLLRHWSLLYNRYYFVFENDAGIETAISKLKTLTPMFQNGKLTEVFLNNLQGVFERIEAHQSALLNYISPQIVAQYFTSGWNKRLFSALTSLLSRIIERFFDCLTLCKMSQLQLSLTTQDGNGGNHLVCTPSVTSAEQFLYNFIGLVYKSFQCSLEKGFKAIGVSSEKAHNQVMDILRDCNEMMLLVSSKNSGTPFQRIRNAVMQANSSIEKWVPFVQYAQDDPRKICASDSGDEQKNAFLALSCLARAYDAIISLESMCEDIDSSRDILIALDTTLLKRKMLSNIKDYTDIQAVRCAEESAALSQALYQRVSDEIQSLHELSSGHVLDIITYLHGVKEDVLPSCRRILADLAAREELFERITNKIIHSSTSLTLSTESWVLYYDLKPHVERLEALYDQSSRSSLPDKATILNIYEDMRNRYQRRMATIFADFQNIRGKDGERDNFFNTEELIQDLEHQLQELEREATDIEKLAGVLEIETSVDRNGPHGILCELKRLRESLTRFEEINNQISLLGTIQFSKAEFSSIETSLRRLLLDVEEITSQTGSNTKSQKLSDCISNYLRQLPLLRALQSVELSAPRERELMKRLFADNSNKDGLQQTSIIYFWEADVLSHEEYLKEVFRVAAGEALIADFLRGVESKWSVRKCQFLYRDNVPLLQGIPEILDEVEEHIGALETMKVSPNAKLFESDRAAWEKRLARARETIELLSEVQSRWANLRTLFGSQSTASSSFAPLRELHEEISSFANVHARFSSIGMLLSCAPGIIEGLETDLGLEDIQEELRGIVRGLSRFLEKQRAQFPRFFFLSDDDLLHVISISSFNLEGLQPHISKLFPGIARFTIETNNEVVRICCVESKEGEVLSLLYPVSISGKPIITWLRDMENSIRCSLKQLVHHAIGKLSSSYGDPSAIAKGFSERYQGFPVQSSILALRILFTEIVDQCLDQPTGSIHGLKAAQDCIEQNLVIVSSLRNGPECMKMPTRVFSLLRDQLIKEFVYQRDVINRIQICQGDGVQEWLNELRFYVKSNGKHSDIAFKVSVHCSCARFDYGWEYLGVGEALVRTSLTSRCFVILSEAMRRGYGGSPFGPAGTGKTETVKSMGRALGRLVSVFNCDESFDAMSVGRILAGACRIGCWICFDEFNRLSASILSSTSGQLAALQEAIRKDEKEIANFNGGDTKVLVASGVAVFVTMNPTYSGRRELPANLKSLFRPCSMSRPDTQPIAEVLLLSENFKYHNVLSRKITMLFEALQSLLSKQPHYDFGLRSLKSAIIVCGSLLKVKDLESSKSRSLADEEDIIVRGVSEVVKPKLNTEDVLDYETMVSGTFLQHSSNTCALPPELEVSIAKVVSDQKLVLDSVFVEKVRQLHSLLQHHCGVIMVGETGSGKSTVWKVLFDAMKLVASKLQTTFSNSIPIRSSLTVVDAKLLSTKQLYGSLDPLTREWTDGLFTKTLRSIAEERPSKLEKSFPLHWIVFDADVDPDWIETLNSVLDDNRILTLPSGEQLPLLPNTRILFETDHLRHANLSSVSRCGLICFGNESFVLPSFNSAVIDALKSISPIHANLEILKSMTGLIYRFARSVLTNSSVVMEVSLQSLLHSFLTLFSNTLHVFLSGKSTYSGPNKNLNSSTRLILTNELVIKTMLVCAVKSLGAGLIGIERQELSRNLRSEASLIEEVNSTLQGATASCFADVGILPSAELLEYEDMVQNNTTEVSQRDIASPDIVIPTPTTVRLEHLLRDALNLNSNVVDPSCPLVLCGPPGCGKSMILMSALREIPNISLAILSFSSETSPENLLTSLKGHASITKRSNGTFVMQPKSAGYRVILFCDEVNLQKPDCYETQTSIAFLRSMTERGGFWTGSPPYWVSIEGIQIVAACNPSDDAGRHRLPPRFLRHCFVVRVEEPTPTDLEIIYGSFNGVLLQRLNPGLHAKKECLTTAMVNFFTQNKEKFSSLKNGHSEAHYIYSPRDLSRWIRGMLMLLCGEAVQPSFSENLSSQHETEAIWVDVISAFCYEARRLFRDRLVDYRERNFVETQLLETVHRYLNTGVTSVPEILYTSWLGNDNSTDRKGRRFRVVEDSQVFRSMIYEKLRVFAEEQGLGGTWISGTTEIFNSDDHSIDQFAVTDDVLTHLTRIERILCQPLGHAVLIGASGTGKKTLARFAAWMLSIEVHQVRSHSSYTELEFAKDMRNILRRASVNNQEMLMIFDESHAMETAFLEMMNSLLACGEVPGLFTGDERTRLLEDLRQASSQSSSTDQALYSEFVHRIRINLHIVFTISLASPNSSNDKSKRLDTLSDLSKRSPALYNRCTVDWIGDWSRQTLEAVAELKIKFRTGAELEQISHCAVDIHVIARDFIDGTGIIATVTPRHYLEFVEQVNRITFEKGGNIDEGVDRYEQGLGRLRAAGDAVEDLKEALGAKAENLRIKENHANDMLQKMIEEQRLAEKSKVEAEHLAAAAEEASEAAKEREEEVALQLSEVLPKIETARQAVGSIRKENLEELRAMPNPPEPVRLSLEAVVMMLDGPGNRSVSQLTWGAIRARMRSPDFIPSVISFDGANLSKNVHTKIISRTVKNPSFDVDKISYASRAAGPLAQWTLAVLDFLEVQESVEPLQQEVSELQLQQADYLERREAALDEASSFKERIDECRAEYARLVSEAERIRQDISESETNILRAENMLDSLGDEWKRWIADMMKLRDSATTVWGDSVLTAAFVAYAGPLDYVNRINLCTAWKKAILNHGMSLNNNLSVANYLTTSEQRGRLSTNGLPTDESSLENYAILRRSARFPLIVDPTRGCVDVLKYVLLGMSSDPQQSSLHPEEFRISISSFSATGKKSYMRALESAVRFGTDIILEDTERYDHAVTPLLGQEVFYGDSSKSGSLTSESGRASRRGTQKFTKNVCQRVVRLGDRDVFLDDNFCLYLAATDLGRVPQAAITRANVVSFELSAAALGATCVSRSLKIMAPDVERRRTESLSATVELKNRKRTLEEKVLSTINNVDDLGTNLLSGPLLHDLHQLKREVREISERQKEGEAAIQEIREKEIQFEPLGKTAVDVFSVIQSLPAINSIYRFNSELFLNVFESAIHHCVNKAGSIGSVSLLACQQSLIEHTLSHFMASLFPRDRLPFAAALVLASYRERLSPEKGVEELVQLKNLRPIWSRALARVNMELNGEKVMSVEDFEMQTSRDVKKSLDNCNQDADMKGSAVWQSSLSILNSSLRNPQEISASVEDLACVIPGCRKVIHGTNAGPEGALRKAIVTFFKIRKNPVSGGRMRFRPLLLCAKGETCDPAASTVDFASDAKVAVISLAMGSAVSDDMISNTISTASRRCDEGKRVAVLVKNMHLASKSALNRIQSEVSKEKGALPCLLIMVVEVSSEFSKGIVISLSSFFHILAFESPPSFRSNFSLAVERISSCRTRENIPSHLENKLFERLHILVSWLHATILERASHCPVGFTKDYDFSEADLSAAWDVMLCLLKDVKTVDGATVRALTQMLTLCVYGCRVERDNDHDIIRALVQGLFKVEQINGDPTRNSISVARAKDGQEITAPSSIDKLVEFYPTLPLHAAAEWCRLPSDTGAVAQTKSGIEALQKVLVLSKEKFTGLEPSKEGTNNETSEKIRFDQIFEAADAIPYIDNTESFEARDSVLIRFVIRELEMFKEIVQRVKNDVIGLRETSNQRETRKMRELRKELMSLTRSGFHQVPSRWQKLCNLFGGEMNACELFSKIGESAKLVCGLRIDTSWIDLRAILRPKGLLTALRYEESERRKVSPHRLHALVLGAGGCSLQEGRRILRGLRLTGAQWDSASELFTLSGNMFSCTANEFCLGWADFDEDEKSDIRAGDGREFIPVNVFERGRSRAPIWTVYIVARKGESLLKWRLNGVSLSLR